MSYPTYPRWETLWDQDSGTPEWVSFSPDNRSHYKITVQKVYHDVNKPSWYQLEVTHKRRDDGRVYNRRSGMIMDWMDVEVRAKETREKFVSIFHTTEPETIYPEWVQFWTLSSWEFNWTTSDPKTNTTFYVEISLTKRLYRVCLFDEHVRIAEEFGVPSLTTAQDIAQSYRDNLWSFVVLKVL